MPDNATTTLFLPANGSRRSSNGQLYNQGIFGHYWSNTVTGNDAYSLLIGDGYVHPANINYRAYGFAIRCIKHT
jgi:hypothetical protein